jgi:hypothetical protein
MALLADHVHLKLNAVRAIVPPSAARFDELASCDGRVTDDGDQIALAVRLDPQHAEAAVLAQGTSPARQGRRGSHSRLRAVAFAAAFIGSGPAIETDRADGEIGMEGAGSRGFARRAGWPQASLSIQPRPLRHLLIMSQPHALETDGGEHVISTPGKLAIASSANRSARTECAVFR